MKSKKTRAADVLHYADANASSAPGVVRGELAVAAALAVFTFLLYLPSLSNSFVKYDDHYYVTSNPTVQKGLTAEGFVWAFTTTHFSNWLPVTWLSHMLDCQLYGMNAGGHHATSALLHAINAAVLFVALRRMTARPWASLAVAALWAVHPLRVESVAWVAERKDVLCGTFFMLALLAYAHYGRKPTVLGYLAVAACHALGLMSKTMLVTLPCVLLLLDYWPLRRLRFGPAADPETADFPQRGTAWLVVEKLPLVVLSIVASAWTFVIQKEGGTMWGHRDLTFSQKVANAFVSVPRYLLKIAWPKDLSVFYPHPGSWPPAKVGAAVGLVALISVAAVVVWRRRPYVTVGWFWFLGMLVPVSGIIQVGLQSMADRYTYLPSIGLVMALVWWVGDALRRRRTVLLVPVATLTAIVLLTFSVVTVRQQAYWKNTYELFMHAKAVDPDNYIAWDYVAGEYGVNAERAYLAGDQGHAKEWYTEAARLEAEAVRLNPTHYVSLHNNGWYMYRLNRLEEAKEYYRRSIQVNPEFGASHLQLGIILAQEGKLDEAMPLFREAVRLQSWNSEGHQHLAEGLLQQGRKDEAIAELREALRLNPRNDDARYWLEQATAPTTAPATAPAPAPATRPGKCSPPSGR
jgi:cytochrome c-type biogenesis protein CcmH/NrfG